MSMLAERRQKQRWSLNPRGKLWLEDNNAFGQKMLEKMGWKHGKGLGANEDGCTESLQVTYKNDNKGMGYKEIEGWTAHEDNFSSLLKNLNQNTGEESEDTKITSLEKKVQNSRARINYHKFTKAKDLSRYSEKDLANIFGKKSLKQTPNNEASTHEEKPIENSKIGNRNDLLVNKGSMLDYFKKKLPNFGKNHSEKDTIDESDCENMKIGFGFSQNHNKNYQKKKRSYTDAISSTEGSSDEPSKKKKAKTSKMSGTFVSYVYQDDCQVNRLDKIEEKSSLECEGHKKKKSKQKNREDTINVEENQNPTPEDSKKKKSKSNIEENIDFEEFHGNNQTNSVSIEANSKSKKKKQKNETGIDQIICDESIQNDEEQMKIDKKQKKSKKNHEESINLGISNAAFCDFNNSELEEVENQVLVEDNCDQPKKSKKKSKKDRVNEEIDPNIVEVCRTEKKKSKKNKQNQVAHETNEYQLEICESEQATKKQKKSKKFKTTENDNCGISNPAFCDNNTNSSNNCISQEDFDQNQEGSDNDAPKRKKKKKRKSKNIENGIDNPTFNPTSDSADTTQESEDVFQKNPKGCRKSSEELNLGVDNPTLNLNDIILDSDLMLNVVSTPVILKKPSIEKVALNSRIERIKNVRRKSVRFNDVLEEHIIPNDPSERVNEYISQRNELFDINTMVIEEGIKEEMEKNGMKYERGPQISNIEDPEELNQLVVESSVKEELNRGLNPQAGFINNAFDIRSVDKIDFYDDKYEIKTSPNTNGIDNRGFNKLKTQIDENIEDISNTIDRYQAEVENDINESKDTQNNHQPPEEWLVGEVGSQINQNTRVKRVTKLCFKEMHFKTPIPHYLKGQNINRAKKSYRHLIRGDITLAFKDANLHEIKGYAAQNGERQVLR